MLALRVAVKAQNWQDARNLSKEIVAKSTFIVDFKVESKINSYLHVGLQ